MKTFFLFVLIIAAVLFWKYEGYNQHTVQSFLDTYTHKTYLPSSPEIEQLANEAGMTDKAKQIFYSTNAQVDTDRTTFEQHCNAPHVGNSVELGCYANGVIYIMNIPEPKLQGQMVVVAAHEMLHAAYSQLSDPERSTVNQELEVAFSGVKDRDLSRELRVYRQTEPGQRDNELHSILGTEYADLGSSLDTYYSQYFTDRSRVVAKAQEFNTVFSNLDAQLSSLRKDINETRAQMSIYLHQRTFQSYRAYNALVPHLREVITEYNDDVREYNQLSRSLLGTESQ